MQRSAWLLAALGDPRGLGEGALGHQTLNVVTSATADSATVLYNLLLDGDHSYWIVQSGAAPLMQTISAAPDIAIGTEKAYLIHNKGG